MKRLSILFAVAAIAACGSPSDQLCIETAKCAEEEDPAKFCEEQKADLSEEQKKIADACKAENDALASCLLAEGTCEDKLFPGEDAIAACADQAEAHRNCVQENG